MPEKTKDEALADAYIAGAKSATVTANPYDGRTAVGKAWYRGWRDAGRSGTPGRRRPEMTEPLKTYVKMQGPTRISGVQWVEWGSVRYDDLAAAGWQVIPGDQTTPEEISQYWTAGRAPDELAKEWSVRSLAERLLVAAYSAGLPIQGEDVRTVVRQARLFYDELEHPTEPPAPPIEERDDEA